MGKVNSEKIRRFDFAKKPVNPCFLMGLAKLIISWPDLKKRGLKLIKVNMEGMEGPYLLLVTHSSMVDFNIMLKATHPARVNNVMTLEGFQTYTEPLMRSLGVIGTRKFITDTRLIRNIKYSIEKLGNIFVLFPEARYSLDGCTSYIPDWSNWERECVRKEIEEGTYYFEDKVRIETLPNAWRFYKQGMGKLIQTPSETIIQCNYYGEEYTLVKSARDLECMHIEYDYLGRGDCVDISIPDDSFWCYLSKRDAITKLSFATEEIHKHSKKQMG